MVAAVPLPKNNGNHNCNCVERQVSWFTNIQCGTTPLPAASVASLLHLTHVWHSFRGCGCPSYVLPATSTLWVLLVGAYYLLFDIAQPKVHAEGTWRHPRERN